MKINTTTKGINWLQIFLFYSIILIGTYLIRKLPNLLNLLLEKITSIPFSFNYNHGLITLITALLFYRFTNIKQTATLLGNHKLKNILFPVILLGCYSVYGIENNHGVNKHVWAIIFCSLALIYNIMEEYAWRGYLIDSLSSLNFISKSLISGIFWAVWHLLVFQNFDQYGGFWIFLLFCLIFSFILTFAIQRTNSVLASASIHGFITQMNIATIVCFVLFMLVLFTWNRKENPTAITISE